MRLRPAACACALLFAGLVAAGEPATYPSLPAHKALAVALDDPTVRGIASGEPSDQGASITALKNCAAQRPPPAVCELTRLNDADITTGQQIRDRVARSSHPLFLWQFESAASRVYLAGSIHVMKPSLFPLPRQFDQAFARANRLALEVDMNALSPQTIQDAFRRYALLSGDESIGTVLRPATLAALSAYLSAQSIPTASVTSLKPSMLATQLAVARLSALGYLPEFGLERHFVDALGERPTLELETLDEQLAVLTSPTLQVQDEMLAETLDQMDGIEPVIAAMIVAWLSGDDREFRRLFDLQSGTSPEIQAFMRRLLEDRNVGMADKVAGYLQTPGTTFVLVGAAHLTGPEGVVALLEARGLKGRRINSNDPI
jgi:uncharacterized protein YbaP (TraB family)